MMVEQVIAQVHEAEKSSRFITVNMGNLRQGTTLGAVPWFTSVDIRQRNTPVARPSRVQFQCELCVNRSSLSASFTTNGAWR